MLFYNVWPLYLEESLIFRLYENYFFGFSGLHELKTSPLVIRTRTGFLTVHERIFGRICRPWLVWKTPTWK